MICKPHSPSRQDRSSGCGRNTPLRLVHQGYKLLVSPLFQIFGVRCRFYPECSTYAVQAIETHGVLRGSYYALRRLLRCHPCCVGGIDPVPPASSHADATKKAEDNQTFLH